MVVGLWEEAQKGRSARSTGVPSKRYVEDSCKARTQPAAFFTPRYLHDTIRSQFIDFHTAIAGPEFNIPPRMILPDEVEHIWL